MVDRPIIFSAPMVRALLSGHKTQTRRLVDAVTQTTFDDIPSELQESWEIENRLLPLDGQDDDRCLILGMSCSYKVGDRLYVREAHRFPVSAEGSQGVVRYGPLYFEADQHWFMNYERAPGRLRPSIHMPRWASRLTLTVTDVRVQRLQEISETDARAEGGPFDHKGDHYDAPSPEIDSWQDYGRASFCLLWNILHGPGAWEANPWVVALTFTVEQRNIDAAPSPSIREPLP